MKHSLLLELGAKILHGNEDVFVVTWIDRNARELGITSEHDIRRGIYKPTQTISMEGLGLR